MTLDESQCWERLRAADHGVVSTMHETRGVDAVPAVYAIVGDQIVVPVDTVKPKSSTLLQRLSNIERDPRCVLLVDHYTDEWSQLWWVRVHAHATVVEPSDEAIAALAARYLQYASAGSIVSALLLTPQAISGWAAT